jgi:hypothetical protein
MFGDERDREAFWAEHEKYDMSDRVDCNDGKNKLDERSPTATHA